VARQAALPEPFLCLEVVYGVQHRYQRHREVDSPRGAARDQGREAVMNWQVENRALQMNESWVPIAQFLWKMDAEDFIQGMVRTRGYSEGSFRITEVSA
jgi:hypothetical protein